MPCFFVVIKLLMLKILLASISGLHGYEFGYHPSAEEFDNFMRETTRTWTRDLLANERRRSLTEPPIRDAAGFFVPKYSYDNAPNRFASAPAPGVQNAWPGHVQKLPRPQPQRHDQQSTVATPHVLIDSDIGSSLDFTPFSEDHSAPLASQPNEAQQNPILQTGTNSIDGDDLSNVPPIKQTLSSVIQIESSPGEAASESIAENQHSIDQLYKNHSNAHFPIFFTNPATGIVYAITEVGRQQNNSSHSNDTIPIYITKEQYDRDLYLLRNYYEERCRPATADRIPSVISMASNTTTRPQIIRLQKPTSSVSKLPIAKPPLPVHKPPSVMVQTEVTVKDQTNVPLRRKKKPKPKRKKKKKPNKPGRKPAAPIVAHSRPVILPTKSSSPHIVLGTHGPAHSTVTTTEKQLSTQLEKPSLSTTIFSKHPLVKTGGFMTPDSTRIMYANHRMRRSVTIRGQMERLQHDTHATDQQQRWSPNLEALPKTFVADEVQEARSSHKLSSRREGRPRARNRTIAQKTVTRKTVTRNGTDNFRLFNKQKRTKSTDRRKHNARRPTAVGQPGFNTTSNAPPVTQSTAHNSMGLARKKYANDTQSREGARRSHKRRKKKRRDKDSSVFDIFDLMDDDDDDHDDDDDGDDDDDNDSYYVYDETDRPPPKRVHVASTSASTEQKEDYTTETIDDLQEDATQDDASSAEEDADYGAMDEPESQQSAPYERPPTVSTKIVGGKKRIRRRPPVDGSHSYEDYNDDDDDDDDGGGGIGGFFRMIFYPVQVFMNRMFDGFSEKDDETDRPTYPTYTLYNSAAAQQPIESEEDSEEQGNSLSSWFGSWLGFNRRTKNIGSTTPSPQPPPTEAPGWLESWFGYDSKGTADSSADDDYDDNKWFFGWFDAKPKRRRKATTTTTTVHTPPAQMPILTIVDPLHNPQNWIGILAHHIINSTSTTTQNPILNAVRRATQNPDIPRRISYDKYQIWRLKPLHDGQVRVLEEYKKSEEGAKLQWLKGPSLRGLTDVLVPPKMLVDFEGSLSFESIAHEVLIYDVGRAIAYEKAQEQYYFSTTPRPHKHHKQPKHPPPTMSWHKYYAYDDIITHLEQLRMRHPQLIELIHIGRSYEGRPLVVVKVESREMANSASQAEAEAAHGTRKKLRHKKKPSEANAVFIESGTHGLEWIGPATSLWMISELLRLIKSNKTGFEHDFVRNTTWYLLPVLNPDGYVYTHRYDRFWKKTRSRHIAKPSGIINSAMTWLQQKKAPERVCYGVDLDRNWHYQWGKRGSSKAPCNEMYAGPAPFSEPETKALSEFLIDYRKQIKLYISMQAYGQIVSYPIKANASFNAERIDDFLDVAMVSTDGLRKKGSKSRYKIDSSSDLGEHRSGCSDAFAAYEVGIPFSYTIQLADNGVHGYLLPSSSIEQTARDVFEIISAMIDYI